MRHGQGPERVIQTGIGPVPVRRVKLRDRGAGPEGERIRFTSAILPRWARRTPSLDALLPVLYLRGVSMGDFQEALGGPAGQGGAEPVACGDRTATGRWAGGLRPLAAPRPGGAALRLPLGRRRLPAGADGAAGRVHAGADRRDAGGQEGVGRLSGRPAGERPELAGAAGRPQGSWPGDRARVATGDGALGFWKSLEEVFPDNTASTMLGAQDGQCHGQAAEVGPARGEGRTCARSGRRRTVRRQRQRWRPSPRNTGPNTRRRSPA